MHEGLIYRGNDKSTKAACLINIFLADNLKAAMSLSGKDKAAVKALWAKAEGKASEIGAEALGR